MDVSTPLLKTHLRWLLTGQRGAGKTAFCRVLVANARAQGLNTAGLLSPAVFKGKLKTGILAEDVRTGESHPLASSRHHSSFDLQLGNWYFDRSSLAWGNHILENSLSCDLLIIDEMGPLELTHRMGWQSALDILRRDQYRLALVVIRPELQAMAHSLFTFSETIAIDHTKTAESWLQFYWPKIKMACLPDVNR